MRQSRKNKSKKRKRKKTKENRKMKKYTSHIRKKVHCSTTVKRA
jgi:hypothetical protein